MHNLRHFYYQNKEKIWKIILLVAFILGIIYLMNMMTRIQNEKKATQAQVNNITYNNDIEKTYIENKTAISGENVSEDEKAKIDVEVNTFLKYCRDGRYKEAYSMLSDDCKNERYNTIEDFSQEYVKQKFNNNQTYNVQKWKSQTYRVEITEDILSTGKVENQTSLIEYITLVTENGQTKLNINNYIGKEEINRSNEQKNVKITVIDKKVYMDYEIYNFKVENLSNKTIKLDSLEKNGTIYLKDISGNKYKAYCEEIFDEEVTIKTKRTLNLSIKFANTYSWAKEASSITFENLILDYDKYKQQGNNEDSSEIEKFVINL